MGVIGIMVFSFLMGFFKKEVSSVFRIGVLHYIVILCIWLGDISLKLNGSDVAMHVILVLFCTQDFFWI